MKVRALLFIIICFVFSCQNESADNQITWVQKIDRSIQTYEKTQIIEKSIIDGDSIGNAKRIIYKEDVTGLYKIEAEMSYGKVMDFKRVFYIRNEEIIKSEIFGFTQYIQKGKKIETTPCCEHFEEIIYFKSPLEGLKFKKELPVIEFEDKQRRFDEFEQLDMKEERFENPKMEYEKFLEMIGNLKEMNENKN